MHIHLNDNDISMMPTSLRTALLDWLSQCSKSKDTKFEHSSPPKQLEIHPKQLSFNFINPVVDQKEEHSYVKLTQLYDAGITKKGMPVRIKLKREVAKKIGRGYADNLAISAGGTIIYKGEKFDKPSPLATKINGSPVNGWEYIEVKIDGEWIRLEELRQIWRKTNG